MRLIADGVVDRDGVTGLARRLGYTERHVHRQLVSVVGVGPLALARAQRAQIARILLETTAVAITEVAFAAGFQSVRQFNATIRDIFALSPRELRARTRRHGRSPESGAIGLRLPYRSPLDATGLAYCAEFTSLLRGTTGAWQFHTPRPHSRSVSSVSPRCLISTPRRIPPTSSITLHGPHRSASSIFSGTSENIFPST